jgi:hypothetical protein
MVSFKQSTTQIKFTVAHTSVTDTPEKAPEGPQGPFPFHTVE